MFDRNIFTFLLYFLCLHSNLLNLLFLHFYSLITLLYTHYILSYSLYTFIYSLYTLFHSIGTLFYSIYGIHPILHTFIHFLIASGSRDPWFHSIGEMVIPTKCKLAWISMIFQFFNTRPLLGQYLSNTCQVLAKYLPNWPMLGLYLAYTWLMLGLHIL